MPLYEAAGMTLEQCAKKRRETAWGGWLYPMMDAGLGVAIVRLTGGCVAAYWTWQEGVVCSAYAWSSTDIIFGAIGLKFKNPLTDSAARSVCKKKICEFDKNDWFR